MSRPSYVPPAFAGKCKLFPERDAFMLGYQRRWIEDSSRLKLMEKGRQIGLSWSTSYRLVSKKSLQDARLDAWVSSRDDLQARLFLEDCKAFSGVLQTAVEDLGQQVIDEAGHSAYVLRFANGCRLHSMSSNPDAQAGKRGDRVLDEFALHPDPRKLWSIAYPGITWGGSMEVISTHRGSANLFNQLVLEIKHKDNPKKISLHTVTLQTALDDGFLYKLQSKLPAGSPILDMDETDYFNHVRSGCVDEESFLQEYMCQPADDASAFLPYELIDACKYPANENWEALLPALLACPNPLYIGVDIGRVSDLTVIWVIESAAGAALTRRLICLKKCPFDEQERRLYEVLALPSVRRCCIDNTGIGRQFTERAQQRFGQYKVEAVTFTAPVKEALAYPLRAAFEDKTVRIPDDRAVVADLRAIRKETTAAGNIRFAADRGPGGHADRFWALALALHAAKTTGYTGAAEHIRAWGRRRGREPDHAMEE
jgi:phage FluMu gp28-like protein